MTSPEVTPNRKSCDLEGETADQWEKSIVGSRGSQTAEKTRAQSPKSKSGGGGDPWSENTEKKIKYFLLSYFFTISERKISMRGSNDKYSFEFLFECSCFLMSVVILTGIHKGKLKRCADPRLSCHTPAGTVCNPERCTVHRCWDPGQSGGF